MKNIQDEFFMPNGIYLLNHSVGLLPKNTYLQTDDFFNPWKNSGGNAWNEWILIINKFCSSLAMLLNGDNSEFCPQTNISSALVKLIYSLPSRKGRKKILFSELDFPSIGFVIKQAEKLGYDIDCIPACNDDCQLDVWESYLKDDVQLAFITHVFSENSAQNPVKDITNLTKAKEIVSVVDIAQSVGVIPIDLKSWDADFVVGSSIKWLCGGPGAAFLWVNSNKINQFSPIDVGWFSHENPFEFNIHHFQYANSALRFLGGTPSVLPLYLANSSINKIIELGISTIYKHNQKLLDVLIHTAINNGLLVTSNTHYDHRGGTLVIQFNDQQKAIHYFEKKNIMVDERPRFGVRFSPHIYNTDGDIEAVSNILKKLSR